MMAAASQRVLARTRRLAATIVGSLPFKTRLGRRSWKRDGRPGVGRPTPPGSTYLAADEIMALALELFAHDVRSPLASSRRAVDQLLRQRQVDDGQAFEILTAALENIDRSIRDLLELERLESGSFGQATSIADLARTCLDACSSPERVRIDTVATHVQGDPALLSHALSNLLDNALRYTRTEVRLRAKPAGRGTVLMVEDDGAGIPPSLRELVFRPLVRLDPDDAQGSGLGLSLVRRVAEIHGGRAWAEEAPRGGARLCLWLPGPDAPKTSRAGPSRRRRRVADQLGVLALLHHWTTANGSGARTGDPRGAPERPATPERVIDLTRSGQPAGIPRCRRHWPGQRAPR